ncbi:MAG: hypothetical protein HYZ44_15220 [Bacteroidetes bacterium]|nr:hypothetical protein [Bacteroidota bacterium]
MIRAFFFLISISAFSQSQVSISGGYSGFAMASLRNFQTELEKQFLIKPKVMNSFPSYYSFGVNYLHYFEPTYFIGGHFFFTNTGGRLSYSDYSGEQLADQILRNISLGASIGKSFRSNERFEFQLSLRLYYTNTNLDLTFKNRIGSIEDVESFGFGSSNLSLEPNAGLIKWFGLFGIRVDCGYNISVFNGKLYLKNDNNVYLISSGNSEVVSDWSGYRLNLGVTYRFSNN